MALPVAAGARSQRRPTRTCLFVAAAGLREAAHDIGQRSEREVFGPTVLRATLVLDCERRTQ